MASISEVVRTIAGIDPQREALVFEGRRTTYAEMHAEADVVADALLSNGLSQGDRWAYLGGNSDRFFIFLLGAIRSGTCLVPVNWRLSEPEARFIIEDSQAKLIFADRPNMPMGISLAQAAALPDAIPIEGDNGRVSAEYEAWLKSGSGAALPLSEDPSASFIQLYTSGTTGQPKGVLITNGSYTGHLERLSKIANRSIRPIAEDVNLLSMPVFHVSGTGIGLETLHPGGKLVITRFFSLKDSLHLISSERITRTFLVPAALKMMLDNEDIKQFDLTSLINIQYGGGPISRELRDQAWSVMSCGFAQYYGMTETAGNISALEAEMGEDQGAKRSHSVGRPLPGTNVRIVGDKGDVMPVGETGEIQVQAISNTVGYWNRPEANAELFANDGWLRTGDIGELDEDGFLYIRGRLKDMIISGGENIYPKEVESVIDTHPDVDDVAVIGVPDLKWGEAVCAFVIAKPGHDLADLQLLEWLQPRLAGYKIPRHVCFVTEFPRTASGKVKSTDLRSWWADMQAAVANDSQGFA